MNLDTSEYYPKSHLDDEDDIPEVSQDTGEEHDATMPQSSPDAYTSEQSDSEPSVISEPTEQFDNHIPTETERLITLVSHFLSWALVPMLMPVYGIMFCFGLTVLAFTGAGTKLAFISITFAFNVVIPAIIVLLLKRFGLVDDLGLNNRKERFIPYIVCIVCLIGTALFMHFKGAPQFLFMFFLGGAAAGIIEVIVNRWWKISVHAAGIAGIVALLLHILQFEYTLPDTLTWLMISLGAAGLLGSARIWLGRHTLWQVLAGYAVGFCGVYFLMLA